MIGWIAFNLNKGVESEVARTVNHQETYIMGVSADYPPFEYTENGKVKGFSIDLARALAQEMGFNLKIEDMDFSNIIPALQTGRINFAISSIAPSETRKENISFSNSYYVSYLEMLMQSKDNAELILKYDNRKIAAQIGSSMHQYLQDKQKKHPSLQVIALAKVPQMLEELRLSRIDAILLDERVAKALIQKNPDFKSVKIDDYTGENAIAFKKDSPLVDEFNEALNKLRQASIIADLEKKWLHQEVEEGHKN
jgi:polar amino acid transport system substrate-binding protein